MGSGASVDDGATARRGADGRSRYFCHMCRRPFSSAESVETRCPHCDETFVEQVEEFRFHSGGAAVPLPLVRRDGPRPSRGGLETDDLSEEQRSRLFHAAALLQLLEAHLRDELQALERAVRTQESNKPSCPICSEDFTVGEQALQLQCSHFFHDGCVVPWLELKHNCPICRCEVSDRIPTLPEIKELTIAEIRQRILWHGEVPAQTEDRIQLARDLHEILLYHRESFNEKKPSADSVDAEEATNTATERTGMRPGHTYTISSNGVISEATSAVSEWLLPSGEVEDRGRTMLEATGAAFGSDTNNDDSAADTILPLP